MGNDTAGVPTDGTTLTEVLEAFSEGGFDGQFEIESADLVRCVTCGASNAPERFEMVGLRRLEGASDPDDMLGVYAVVCPACHRRGVLVLGFGPSAPEAEADVGHALSDQRQFRT